MEVVSIMQVSSRHLKPSTLKMIENEEIPGLVSYKKDNYGFFIVANSDGVCFDTIPAELAYLMGVAETIDSYYLEVDHAVETTPDLQVFDEEENK
jgi:hypothetical protein